MVERVWWWVLVQVQEYREWGHQGRPVSHGRRENTDGTSDSLGTLGRRRSQDESVKVIGSGGTHGDEGKVPGCQDRRCRKIDTGVFVEVRSVHPEK